MKYINFALFVLLLFTLKATSAQDQQAQQAVLDLAESTVTKNFDPQNYSKISIIARKLDPRLHLKPCQTKLEAELIQQNRLNTSSQTVKVSCVDSWSIHVPVGIRLWNPVLVLNTSLYKGDLLTKSMVSIEEREITRLRSYIQPNDLDRIIGMQSKAQLRPGTVLLINQFKHQQLIKRGQKVVIVKQQGLIHIKVSGVALQAGAKGDLINVKNLSSNRKIQAIIVDSNSVEVK